MWRIKALTSLVPRKISNTSSNSSKIKRRRVSFLSFAPHKVSPGNSFQSVPHTLVVWGNRAWRVWNKRVLSTVKFTFEEYMTVLTQVEACLNSWPLAALPCNDDGCDALTPRHFLIGRPLEALPDPAFSYPSTTLLRRWHLCQNVVRHFGRSGPPG